MFKSLITGIVLGIAAAAAALYFVPIVDQHREQSLIVVQPNRGNTETFHVNVPMDRIMVGAPASGEPVPPGLEWPEDVRFAGMRAELFKLRNARDTVVGVASRIAASDAEVGPVIEWVLHLPARGSVYLTLEAEPTEGGFRAGTLAAGSREFERLEGRFTERWLPDAGAPEDAPSGRIELVTAFMSQAVDP